MKQSKQVSGLIYASELQGALVPFAQGVLGAGYKLVLCGFRIGGAKAQHATATLLDHFSKSPQVQFPKTNIVCVTFGAPQILRIQV